MAGVEVQTPTLTVTHDETSESGCAMASVSTAAQIRCPTRDAPYWSVCDITTANTPPPYRATRSPGRPTISLSVLPIFARHSSPGLMPQSVVVLAETVDVDHHHADA